MAEVPKVPKSEEAQERPRSRIRRGDTTPDAPPNGGTLARQAGFPPLDMSWANAPTQRGMHPEIGPEGLTLAEDYLDRLAETTITDRRDGLARELYFYLEDRPLVSPKMAAAPRGSRAGRSRPPEAVGASSSR